MTRKEYRRKYYLEHREESLAKSKAWRLKHPRKMKENNLKWNLKQYGITKEIYKSHVKEQEGRCAICHKRTSLQVDHDHNTKKFRGLLCHKCNKGLGIFNDCITCLAEAIKYLSERK